MSQLVPTTHVKLIALLTASLLSGNCFAQTTAVSGSSHKKSKLGLSGYCPVCVVEMKQWMKGSSDHRAEFDGHVYFFPGEKQKQKFLGNPQKYAPVLGGDCVVCYAKMQKRVPGTVRHASLRRGRLYLFPGADQKSEFRASPQKYDRVDLAANGNCIVCKVEMGQDMPGKQRFAAIHNGLRYQFPGAKQRDMFLANPQKYVSSDANRAATRNARSKSTNPKLARVSISGKSGCAGCDHGRKPLGAPTELGLAVNTPDGRVYIVEEAHQRYPDVYEKRFDHLQLSVVGSVIKTDGKFTWINPTHLEVAN